VISCYLPPENSPLGTNSDNCLAHLLSQLYLHSDTDDILMCGDVNARIGQMSDFNPNLDFPIPKRNSIDQTINQHGRAFIELLIDSKMCVLNGRFANDNFTSISTKGPSVVDYFMVPHESVMKCKSLNIETCSDFINNHNLQGLLNSRCKAPDHSILTVVFRAKHSLQAESSINFLCKTKKHKLTSIDDTFCSSDLARRALENLVEQIQCNHETQDEIDAIYNDLCHCIYDEMDRTLPPCSKQNAKKYKHDKPYWCKTLNNLWKNMCVKEKAFVKCKGTNRLRRKLHDGFKAARHTFDRTLRRYKREYNRKRVLDIEQCVTDNPRKFWQHIQKLGPKCTSSIPLEVIDINEIYNGKKNVLNTWKD
jgi:hypothetical protein